MRSDREECSILIGNEGQTTKGSSVISGTVLNILLSTTVENPDFHVARGYEHVCNKQNPRAMFHAHRIAHVVCISLIVSSLYCLMILCVRLNPVIRLGVGETGSRTTMFACKAQNGSSRSGKVSLVGIFHLFVEQCQVGDHIALIPLIHSMAFQVS